MDIEKYLKSGETYTIVTDGENGINKNQYVLFENGYKGYYLEIMWDKRRNAFCYVEHDDCGLPIRYYSNIVVNKAQKAKKQFIPTRENCSVAIHPEFETEKAYAVLDGTNGLITRNKEYYRYIAKSICYVDGDGKIYAPVFATKYLDY